MSGKTVHGDGRGNADSMQHLRKHIAKELDLAQRKLVECHDQVLSLLDTAKLAASSSGDEFSYQVRAQAPTTTNRELNSSVPAAMYAPSGVLDSPAAASALSFHRPQPLSSNALLSPKSVKVTSRSNGFFEHQSEEAIIEDDDCFDPEDVIVLPGIVSPKSWDARTPQTPVFPRLPSKTSACTDITEVERSGSNYNFHAMSARRSNLLIRAEDSENAELQQQIAAEPTIIEILCEHCAAAKWAFFFGGLTTWENVAVQRCYDGLFITSFMICFAMCCANYFYRTPPYYDSWIDAATVYFHIVGLHSWIVWRSFVKSNQVKIFARSLFQQSNQGGAWEHRMILQLMEQSRVVAWVLLFVEVVGILLGFVCFSQPAILHWMHSEDPDFKHTFALAHAVIMYAAIPQHVPTMIASLGLFMFLCRLHALDVERIVALVDDPSSCLASELAAATDLPKELEKGKSSNKTLERGKSSRRHATKVVIKDAEPMSRKRQTKSNEELHQEMHTCCELVDIAQATLDFSTGRFQWIWAHQIGYCFLQILIVVTHVRYYFRSGGHDHFSDKEIYKHFYDAWHAYVALLVFLSALMAPALVTKTFISVPHKLLRGMRYRGAETTDAAQLGTYLTLRIQGYRVFGVEMRLEGVYTCLTITLAATSIYLSDFMQMY